MRTRNLEKYQGRRKGQMNLSTKVSEDEHYRLRQMAEAHGLSLSDFCGRKILETIEEWEKVGRRPEAVDNPPKSKQLTIWVDINCYKRTNHAAIDMLVPTSDLVRAAIFA